MYHLLTVPMLEKQVKSMHWLCTIPEHAKTWTHLQNKLSDNRYILIGTDWPGWQCNILQTPWTAHHWLFGSTGGWHCNSTCSTCPIYVKDKWPNIVKCMKLLHLNYRWCYPTYFTIVACHPTVNFLKVFCSQTNRDWLSSSPLTLTCNVIDYWCLFCVIAIT